MDGANVFRCEIGPLGPGETASWTFWVLAQTPGLKHNVANVTGGDDSNSANNEASADVLVLPNGTPTVTVTHPSATNVTNGTQVTDLATVAPAPIFENAPVRVVDGPSGNVTCYVCAVGVVPCASGGSLLGTSPLDNGTATSPPFVPVGAGESCFRGEYSGDANFSASEDGGTNECFNATGGERIPTQTVTTPSTPTSTPGGSVADNATVRGAQASLSPRFVERVPLGWVRFYLCGVNVVPCASGGDLVGTIPLSNGSATSPAVTPTQPGTYCFRGEYTGDEVYAPNQDASTGECFTVSAPIPVFPTWGAMALGFVGGLAAVGAVLVLRRR